MAPRAETMSTTGTPSFELVRANRLIVRESATVAGQPVTGTSLPLTGQAGSVGETLVGANSLTTHHRVKGLVAGAGIQLTADDDDVTIANTGDSDFATLAPEATATGSTLIGGNSTASDHRLRGLTAGTGIALSVVGEDVEIENTGDSQFPPLDDEPTATGASLIGTNSTAATHFLRTALAGAGTSVAVAGEDVVFANTAVLADEPTATGTSLVGTNADASSHLLRTLVGGVGTSTGLVGENVRIANTAVLADEAATTGASLVGTNADASSHLLRTVVGGAGTSATVVSEDVVLANTAVLADEATATGASWVGTNADATAHRLRTAVAGTGISVAVAGEDITIANLGNVADEAAATLGHSVIGPSNAPPNYRFRRVGGTVGLTAAVSANEEILLSTDLSQVLGTGGNTTGGTDIIQTAGDILRGTNTSGGTPGGPLFLEGGVNDGTATSGRVRIRGADHLTTAGGAAGSVNLYGGSTDGHASIGGILARVGKDIANDQRGTIWLDIRGVPYYESTAPALGLVTPHAQIGDRRYVSTRSKGWTADGSVFTVMKLAALPTDRESAILSYDLLVDLVHQPSPPSISGGDGGVVVRKQGSFIWVGTGVTATQVEDADVVRNPETLTFSVDVLNQEAFPDWLGQIDVSLTATGGVFGVGITGWYSLGAKLDQTA